MSEYRKSLQGKKQKHLKKIMLRLQQLIEDNLILQQDNDPKHTCKLLKKYLSNLEAKGALQTMPWPPQSPDLNMFGTT